MPMVWEPGYIDPFLSHLDAYGMGTRLCRPFSECLDAYGMGTRLHTIDREIFAVKNFSPVA